MVKKRAPTTAHAPSKEGPASRDPLATYRSKRNFGVTPEPAPGEPSSPALPEKEKKTALAFVVQKHDATRMHYDVRLEIEGAMASWSVPKGPSYDPEVRRLAVETEDHPMEYNEFEGRIPDGEYGAGDVLIWDRGTYETQPPGQEQAMRTQGHLRIALHGQKLRGGWHLVKTGRRGQDEAHTEGGKAQWLLFKAKDAYADPRLDIVATRPESVVSGRTATRGPARVGASSAGKTAQTLLAAVGEVMLATSSTKVDDPARYLYEIKYDGYRLLAVKAGRDVRLFSRRNLDWTGRFQLIADAVAALPVREAVLDGEACAVDERGRPSFGRLQEWLSGDTRSAKLAYAAFDLLWVDGRDLRGEPIEARRELLEALVKDAPAPLSFSRSIEGELGDLVRLAKAQHLEGLLAKRKGSPYVGGRSTSWLKLKFERRQECAIVGYIPIKDAGVPRSEGGPQEVGALLLGVVRDDGKLHFAGRVGTGFDTRTRKSLAERLDTLRVSAPPLEGAPSLREARWAEPRLVCEIGFAEWTRDGSARQPRFLGLREDKLPMECVREPDAEVEVPPAPPPRRRETPKLANPDKVLFPRDGICKRDVWDYYTAIAPVMLPHLAGRPLTLQRWPDGIEGEEWYQQNAPDKIPGYVRLLEVGEHHGNKKRIVADNVESLQWLANLAALTIHQWASHAPRSAQTKEEIVRALGQPDYFVLDLDPGDGTWAHLVEVALAIRKLLEALELESVVKTSGKRGIHIVVPIARGPSHEQATAFAEQIARAVAKVLPQIATVERMKDKRRGRLYVDFGQNGEGRTIVAPYTIRALDGAPVSTPIAWSEVTESLDPRSLNLRTVLARVEKHGDLFAQALRGKSALPAVQ